MPRPQDRLPTHRFSALRQVLLLAAVAFGALGMGARCYKPDTRTIVFIQGIYTTYDGETQSTAVEGPRFSTLKSAFADAGYEAGDLLDFSYAGGTVDDVGAWEPKDYSCELTDRTAAENLGFLEQMLRDYRAEHDGAHFTLVGHSLGGYLAYLEGVREADRPNDQKLDIDVVVTLDAPLEGVDADKKAIIDAIPCEKTYVAGAEIVAQKFDPGIASTRSVEAGRMAAQGVRLATVGNLNDCLWNTSHCLPGSGFIDDSGTQFVDGATAFSYEVASAPLSSHDAILAHAPAVADVLGFVGEP
ncbi:MAG: hypothetical protein HY873_02050 [Chloroflexi bacterium]|nr:hypothetical protein [Chloroflexota bacterium]